MAAKGAAGGEGRGTMGTDEWASKCPMCKGPAYPVHYYAAQVVEVVCETHEDHRYPVELNPLP